MSPFDDGWLLDSLHELAVEIALNDPRTVSIARRTVMCFALVCGSCRIILKRDYVSTSARPPELAEDHRTHKGPLEEVLGVMLTPHCEGSGRPALWHPIAED